MAQVFQAVQDLHNGLRMVDGEGGVESRGLAQWLRAEDLS